MNGKAANGQELSEENRNKVSARPLRTHNRKEVEFLITVNVGHLQNVRQKTSQGRSTIGARRPRQGGTGTTFHECERCGNLVLK
jgi:hypothetical protein